MQMELHSNARIPDGLLATMTLLSEKTRLGVPSRESTLHQGIDERNCTAVLGLRFGWSEIVSGTVVAPNNAPTVSHCLGAAASAKGVSIGLDILGAIPVFGNGVSAGAGIVRAGIAVNHAITSPVFAVGSGVYGAYGGVTAGPGEATDSLVGSASAGAGIGLALADVSLAGTKAIPIVGNFVSVATLGWDGYQAYKAYQSCLAGH
jgi:hypothetical protein